MKTKNISKEELKKLIDSGEAKLVHFGSVQSVLKVRGSLQKESLSSYIVERLESAYESWTDTKYSDNPDIGALLFHLKSNLDLECMIAWGEFLKKIDSKTE